MQIISRCSNCGARVSRSATRCPKCGVSFHGEKWIGKNNRTQRAGSPKSKGQIIKWLAIFALAIFIFIALISGTFTDEAHHVNMYLADASVEYNGSVDYPHAFVDFSKDGEPVEIVLHDSSGSGIYDDANYRQKVIDAEMAKVIAKDGRPTVSLYDNILGKKFEKINATAFKGDEHTYVFVTK